MRRIQPKKFTKEQVAAISKAVTEQTVSSVPDKSLDPDNYPVFEVPVNSKVFVYVPNHTVVDGETGAEDLRMDMPYIHTVQEGRNRYSKVRCIRGLENMGYSGNCPFCDAIDDGWELANEVIKEKCGQQGLDPEDKNNDTVKRIRSAAFNARAITAPKQYVTFPIVVIETDPNDIKVVLRDEDGQIKFKAMWYTIFRDTYNKKWKKCLEALEDEPTHPGGRCFILNYTYEPKKGTEPNKMDSARELVVVPRKMKNFEKYAEYFDELTKDWDIAKSCATVADNVFGEESELAEEAERIMIPTRDKLALYRSLASVGQSDDKFQLTESNGDDSGVSTGGDIPVETDLDVD